MVSSFSNNKSQLSQKESRHIEVAGIPEGTSTDSLVAYFSTFGKVQKVEQKDNSDAPEFIVSFMDVRSAQKAQNSELQLQGHALGIKVHDAVKSLHGGSTTSASTSADSFDTIDQTRIPYSQTTTANYSRRNLASSTTPVEGRKFNGLQGILVQSPHRLPEHTFKQQLINLINSSKVKSKLIDVSIDSADPSNALILLQNVPYIDSLVLEIQRSTLAALPPDQTLNAKLASHVAVTEAHNNYLVATAGALTDSLPPPPATPTLKNVPRESSTDRDARQKEASRTLYVGSLERKIKEDTLKARFSRFGPIVEVDIKNKDSPAPFAFIQFANIKSVVDAISAFQNNSASMVGAKGEKLKFKVNWGRPIPTAKLWLGDLPRSCSSEYLFNKLRTVTDSVQDIVYDATHNEALVIFKNVEQSQLVHTKIKNRQLIIPPERPLKEQQVNVQQLVDYASDKLHDYFVDRKFGRIQLLSSVPSPISLNSTPVYQRASTSTEEAFQTTSETKDPRPSSDPEFSASHAPETAAAVPTGAASLSGVKEPSVLLVPPPDPPKDLTNDLTQMSSDLSPFSSRHGEESSSQRQDELLARKRIKRKVKLSASPAGSGSSEEKLGSSDSSRHSSPDRESSEAKGHSEPSTSSVGSINDQKLGTSPDPLHSSVFSKVKHADDVLTSPTTLRDIDSPDSFPLRRSSNDSGTPTTPNMRNLSRIEPLHKEDMMDAEDSFIDKEFEHLIPWETNSDVSDPRKNCSNYTTNDERGLFFPSFYTEDESGYRYCRHLHGSNRRPSQPLPVTPQHNKDEKMSPLSHSGITRTISSGSSENLASQVLDLCHERPPSTSSSAEDGTLPPMPPPPGHPAALPAHIERLNALTSRVDSIYEKHSTSLTPAQQARLSGSIEDDLLRFRQRKAQSMSGITTPSTTPSTPQAFDTKEAKQQPKLTINIPPTSSATSSLVSSPALAPFTAPVSHAPLHSPMGSINGSMGRSMSFSMELPASTNMQPRSMSVSGNQPSPALPLPPPPPLLASPKTMSGSPGELSRHGSFSTPRPASPPPPPTKATIPTVAAPSASSNLDPHFALKTKPHLNGTKPVTTPVNGTKPSLTKPGTEVKEHKPHKADSEDHEEKKLKDKNKMLQFMQIPRKKEGQKDSITFVSPLNRGHINNTPGTPTTPPNTKVKNNEKKHNVHTPLPSTSKMEMKMEKKPEKKEKDKEKKEKHRLSVGSVKDLPPKTMSSKERQAAYISEMERIKEKSMKKFPESKKDREQYIKLREAKLKTRFEQLKAEHEKVKKEKLKKQEEKQKLEHSKQKKLKEKEKEKEKEKHKVKPVEKKKSRQRTPSEASSDDDDSEDNNDPCRADFLLKSNEIEAQKILYEAAKNGSLNLSMYERIKRKRTAPRQDENKKVLALAKLREKAEAKKKRRVHLSSCSDDSDTNEFSKKSQADSSADDSDAATTVTNASGSSAAKRARSSSTASKKASTDFIKKEGKRKSEDKESKKEKVKKIKQEPVSDAESEAPKVTKEKKPKIEAKSPVPEMVSEESDGEAAVKAMHDEFVSYKADSDSDDNKVKEKKKKKQKKFDTNFDDIFAANSDDDSEKKAKKKKLLKQQKAEKAEKLPPVVHTGKPGRPKKVKEMEKEMAESKKKKKEEKEKVRKEKTSKRSLDESSGSEPAKKKHKTDEKRRVSDTGSLMSLSKTPQSEKHKASLQSPLSLNLSALGPCSSMDISPTPFTAISPTPSTGSDNVRLENFVTPCKATDTAMFSPSLQSTNFQIMPLESPKSTPLPAPVDDQSKKLLDVPKWSESRKRSSSTSSFNSSSTSGTSTASSLNASRAALEKAPPTIQEVAEEPSTKKLAPKDENDLKEKAETSTESTGPAVKTEESPVAKIEKVSDEPVPESSTKPMLTEDNGPARPRFINLSPTRLLEEINFEDSSNVEDDDDDLEEELLRHMSADPKPDTTKAEPVIDYSSQDTQETEDAIESISAFMENKSDDEDDDSYSHSMSRRINESDYNKGMRTSGSEEFNDEPTVSTATQLDKEKAVVSESEEAHKPQEVSDKVDEPPKPTREEPQEDKISSVIASVARGDSFENSAVSKPNVASAVLVQNSGVFSNISHLPTPPPSRSSGGSPQCTSQFQYPVAQISPQISIAAKKDEPKIETSVSEVVKESGNKLETTDSKKELPLPTSNTSNGVSVAATQVPVASKSTVSHPRTSIVADFQLPIQKDTETTQQMLERFYKQTNTTIPSTVSLALSYPQQQSTATAAVRPFNSQPSSVATTSAAVPNQSSAQTFGQNLLGQQMAKTLPQNMNRIPMSQPQMAPIPAENILAALQVAGIGPNAITPQLLANPSLLISTLASTNPAVAESLQKLLTPTDVSRLQQPTDLARLQMLQQQVKQPFMPLSNPSLMAFMQQEQQRQQMAHLQQQQMGMTPEQTYMEQLKMLQLQRAIKPEIVQSPKPVSQLVDVKTEKANGYGFNRNRYPLCWQGTLAMKSNDATVQLFHISGSQYLMDKTTRELTDVEDGNQTIRINQRMRLTNPQLLTICNQMKNDDEFVAMACVPCGQNTEQLHHESSKMTTQFINYFNTKMTAGVVTHSTANQSPSCIAHFFPPCDWTEEQMNRLSPEFATELKRLVPTYLFVVVTRSDLNSPKIELEQKPVQVPVMPQVCGRTV
ncbi:unnamed protein product [Bursaphelenchus okinawaensis]|uniref:Msx2-interacting protein n=1 Tax=Bursaphelenchus okinawaensis TaxID=465554 RepID=A0A811K703_9BILA|nr:unnamed protein product [Bursaphelenchus okinawaensis]CAG9094518.1 unnamed protein product [Bursaphelenchus okinawaensis]